MYAAYLLLRSFISMLICLLFITERFYKYIYLIFTLAMERIVADGLISLFFNLHFYMQISMTISN